MRYVLPAAKRRKNAAHGASRGWESGNVQAPKQRKNAYSADFVETSTRRIQ
jgi:hypothetical protein